MTSILDYWPQTSLRRYQPMLVRADVFPDAGDIHVHHQHTIPHPNNPPQWIETTPVLSGGEGWAIREAMQQTPRVDQTNPDGSVFPHGIIHRMLIDGVVCETWHVNSQRPGTPILRCGQDRPAHMVHNVLTIDNFGAAYKYRVSNWLKHVGQPWGRWNDTVRCVLCEHHTGTEADGVTPKSPAYYNYVAQRGVGLVEVMGPLEYRPAKDKDGKDLPPWTGKLWWSGP